MIQITIKTPEVRQSGVVRNYPTYSQGWALVDHGINVAYCDTEEEAHALLVSWTTALSALERVINDGKL
jgi:hypothetical protein